MNIILVEDDLNAMEIVNSLKIRDHDVRYCDNVADAEWYIRGNDQEPPFDAMILDLNMSMEYLCEGLLEELREQPVAEGVGWFFWEHVVKKVDDQLYDRTIFYTGYGSSLKRLAGDRFKELRVIEKDDEDMIGNMLRMLRDMPKRV